MLGQGQPGSNARVKIPQKVLQNILSQAWNYCHVAVELGSRGLFLVVGRDAVLGVVLESQGSSPHIRVPNSVRRGCPEPNGAGSHQGS